MWKISQTKSNLVVHEALLNSTLFLQCIVFNARILKVSITRSRKTQIDVEKFQSYIAQFCRSQNPTAFALNSSKRNHHFLWDAFQ